MEKVKLQVAVQGSRQVLVRKVFVQWAWGMNVLISLHKGSAGPSQGARRHAQLFEVSEIN